jgi:superfamily II DNA or RNA helicase
VRAVDTAGARPLRGWQRRALVRYLTTRPRDFLLVATPGAGKTAWALRIAGELLADGTVERVTVVVPTEHLKTQWAAAGRPPASTSTRGSPTPIRAPPISTTGSS